MKTITFTILFVIGTGAYAADWPYQYTGSTPIEVNQLTDYEACSDAIKTAKVGCLEICTVETRKECIHGFARIVQAEDAPGVTLIQFDDPETAETKKFPGVITPRSNDSLSSRMCSFTAFCRAK